MVDERVAAMVVHIKTRDVPAVVPSCAGVVVVEDRPSVVLVDLPCFGRSVRLAWHKRRWSGVDSTCTTGSWTEVGTGDRRGTVGDVGSGRAVGD